jgi:hypothetical protein
MFVLVVLVVLVVLAALTKFLLKTFIVVPPAEFILAVFATNQNFYATLLQTERDDIALIISIISHFSFQILNNLFTKKTGWINLFLTDFH